MVTLYLVMSIDSDFGDKILGVFLTEGKANEVVNIANEISDTALHDICIVPLELGRNYTGERIEPYGL